MTSAAFGALWIFIFALPWENVFVIPGLGTISKLMGIIALGCAALAAVVSGRLRHLNRFHVAALVFLLWAGTSVFRATYSDLAVIKFKTYVQLFAVLWIIWELAPDIRRQRGLLTAYVFGSYVAALLTIFVRPTVAHTSTRFAAEGFDPNDLGMTLALAIPMAWHLGMTYARPLLRWVCRAYLPLGLVAIGLTGSRGAMVATVAALSIVPLTLTRLSAGRKVAAGFLLLIVGAVSVAFIPESSFQRFEQHQGGGGARHPQRPSPDLDRGRARLRAETRPRLRRRRIRQCHRPVVRPPARAAQLLPVYSRGAGSSRVSRLDYDVLRPLSPGAEASEARIAGSLWSCSARWPSPCSRSAGTTASPSGSSRASSRLLRCHAGQGPCGSRAAAAGHGDRHAARSPPGAHRGSRPPALASAPQAEGAVEQ